MVVRRNLRKEIVREGGRERDFFLAVSASSDIEGLFVMLILAPIHFDELVYQRAAYLQRRSSFKIAP